ncbi:polyribonucleotide nucleotidyltransferase [Gottschalkiaceae bacterium SANA]|nr:polyribonucleotide nucleotidyltransferase [Gottschalkiaceae bacterium SANA]
MVREFEYSLAGKTLKVTTGKIAEQAHGSCLVSLGDTVVMANVTSSKTPRPGIDFFPLAVEYQEKFYSAGKIPGGFIKREGRPSTQSILTSRLIDRPMRPLFPKGFRNDVQVVVTALSVEPDVKPDIPAMLASAIAISISDIPFSGPVASMHAGMIDGKVILMPNEAEREASQLDLIVAGTAEAVMMVEAGSNIISEAQMLDGILTSHDEIRNLCGFISEIAAEVGKEKFEFEVPEIDEALYASVETLALAKLKEAVLVFEKQARNEAISAVREEVFAELLDEEETLKGQLKQSFDKLLKQEVRELILQGVRPDSRKHEEIRAISSEVGLLPRTHGSALFTRGQTQAMSILTLGTSRDVQIIDGLGKEEKRSYMHHYNFPPYCTGEAYMMRGPKRREIGHGALAERALLPVLPDHETFPYTIRVVSEVLSSNGSSSQASICGSTLSLMDAGVPITAPVAGIAMGLIKEGDRLAILSDIQGLEDHLGDMDFKVAGTREGITAIQMDIKIAGIERKILEQALESARLGRLYILDKMNETMQVPREDTSPYAPRIISIMVPVDKIRTVIGSGGKTINAIIEETGAKIDIDDSGLIEIAAESGEAGERAKAIIESIVTDPVVGTVYKAKVTRTLTFGAFLEFLPGKEGLIHISRLAVERVKSVEDVVKVGDELEVKLVAIDDQGRYDLARTDIPYVERKRDDSRKSNSHSRDGNRRRPPRRDDKRPSAPRQDKPSEKKEQ